MKLQIMLINELFKVLTVIFLLFNIKGKLYYTYNWIYMWCTQFENGVHKCWIGSIDAQTRYLRIYSANKNIHERNHKDFEITIE